MFMIMCCESTFTLIKPEGQTGNKQTINHSRGTFPILSRHQYFKKTTQNPGETDPVLKRTNQPLESLALVRIDLGVYNPPTLELCKGHCAITDGCAGIEWCLGC